MLGIEAMTPETSSVFDEEGLFHGSKRGNSVIRTRRASVRCGTVVGGIGSGSRR